MFLTNNQIEKLVRNFPNYGIKETEMLHIMYFNFLQAIDRSEQFKNYKFIEVEEMIFFRFYSFIIRFQLEKFDGSKMTDDEQVEMTEKLFASASEKFVNFLQVI